MKVGGGGRQKPHNQWKGGLPDNSVCPSAGWAAFGTVRFLALRMFPWSVGDHLPGILQEEFLPWEQVDDESWFPAVIKIRDTNSKVFNDKKN